MKNQVAASAVAIASLAREGFEPPGDLVFVAAADEEVGQNFGLSGSARAPRRGAGATTRSTRAAASGSSSGASVLPLRDRREDERAVPAARPRPQRPRLDAGDRGQRARQDGAADRAARRLPAEPRSGPRSPASSTRCSASSPPPRTCSPACAVDQLAGRVIEPLLSFTLSPTMIEASERRNVVPGTCESSSTAASCPDRPRRTSSRSCADSRRGRVRAGDDRALRRDALHARHAALDGDLGLGRARQNPARSWCRSAAPGFTDSHWLREAFGTVAYGFFPLRTWTSSWPRA